MGDSAMVDSAAAAVDDNVMGPTDITNIPAQLKPHIEAFAKTMSTLKGWVHSAHYLEVRNGHRGSNSYGHVLGIKEQREVIEYYLSVKDLCEEVVVLIEEKGDTIPIKSTLLLHILEDGPGDKGYDLTDEWDYTGNAP